MVISQQQALERPSGAAPERPNRRAVADWTLEVLLSRIFSGELKPGDQLSEEDLSAEIGVSRSPVREALRRLEADGLVQVSAGNGKREVATFGIDGIREIYDMRAALEGLAAMAAAEVITPKQIAQLVNLQQKMEKAAAGHRKGQQRDLSYDFEFHQLACRIAERPRLERMLSGLWVQTRALIRQLGLMGVYPDDSEVKDAHRDHHRLIRAFEQRDPQAARQAVEDHMRGRRDRLIAELARRGGLPGDERASTVA